MLRNRRGTLSIVHEVEGAERVRALHDALKRVREKLAKREAPWTPHQLSRVHFLRWFLMWDWEVLDGKSKRCLLVFLSCFDGDEREHLRELLESARDSADDVLQHVSGFQKRDVEQTIDWLLSQARYADSVHVGVPGLSVRRILGDARLVDSVRSLLADGPSAWLAQSGYVTRDPTLGSKRGWEGWDVGAALRRWVPSERMALKPLLEEPPRTRQLRIPLWGFLIVAAVPLAGVLFSPPGPLLSLVYVGGLTALAVHLLRGQDDLGQEQDNPGPDVVSVVREDEERATQNPMTLVTRIRDGFANRVGLRAALFTIQLLSRFHFNRGSLGPIYTIHFARWFIVGHPERRTERYLVFESNWDFSWESYLDDFTDGKRTRMSLNMVWRHTVGFPRIRRFLGGGCDDAGPFLAWVRRHQIPTHAWYTAYPSLDLRSILENEARRDGLLEAPKTREAEAKWVATW